MAVLADNDRKDIWASLMRAEGAVPGSLLKPDLRAAVDAIDSWVDANAVAFNQAIPQPARSAMTARQKAALLMYVVSRRFEVS